MNIKIAATKRVLQQVGALKKNRIVLLFFFSGLFLNAYEQDPGFSNFEPTVYPDRIMLTIPGNPATSRAVSWRTTFTNTAGTGEIKPAEASPSLETNNTKVNGTYSPWEEGSITAMGHKVIFDNLKPETKYAYRVGDGEHWSEWFQFTTSSERVKAFSFLYFGDVQNDIKSYCSRTLRQAYTHFPNSDFMMFAGDLVSRSQEEYWREFFYAGGWIFGTMPSMPTPGNHEYDKPENMPRTFSKHWKQIYTMPLNGPSEEFNNRIYYIDYQGVRFVSLDSPAIGEDEEDGKLILEWLDKILDSNPNRWTVLFTHYPVYSCSQDRNNEKYRNAVKPIIEKHGVDIVLQGHDHTYCRGQNLPYVNGKSANNPMYVVSVAGPKMYGLNTSLWSDRVASNTQLYQHITFDGEKMMFTSYTVTGDLYDAFTLIKKKSGVNRFVESKQLSGIAQRTEIPESAKGKYSAEEIQQYNQKIKQKFQ